MFNAVRKQQKLLGDKLVEAGASVRKQDKVMESMTKGKFLDLLKGASSGMVVKVEKEEVFKWFLFIVFCLKNNIFIILKKYLKCAFRASC